MLSRWNTLVGNINLILKEIEIIGKRVIIPRKERRGAKPKLPPIRYLILIAAKEADDDSLREAEVEWSKSICGRRVDHSVIGYWERRLDSNAGLSYLVKKVGEILQKHLNYDFSMIDATLFTTWKNEEIKVYFCNRIIKGSVYPVGISFIRSTIADPVNESTPFGVGNIYGDAEFDNNATIGVLFKKGYNPIVSPNKNRSKGYWRRKARKLYKLRENRLGYRQRSRGESPFGSLTNEFGDRFNTKTRESTMTRTAARVLIYQIKLMIRIRYSKLAVIVRHAPIIKIFKYLPNHFILQKRYTQ